MKQNRKDKKSKVFRHPLVGLPSLQFETIPNDFTPPDEDGCFALWDKYEMFDNIRAHSMRVAEIAVFLAKKANECGLLVNIPTVRAAALLHDIAKTYTVKHGGSHAQLGASWLLQETGNYTLARAVMVHVYWPWKLPEDYRICTVPFFIIYADKRVRHDQVVSIEDRYEDLLKRYGKTPQACSSIKKSHEQGLMLEKLISLQLGMDLSQLSAEVSGL